MVSLIFDVYGNDIHHEQETPTSWCWIRSDVEVAKVFWQFFCGKFWEILAYVIVSVFYYMTVYHLQQQVLNYLVHF